MQEEDACKPISKKFFPMFVDMCILKGGLNQIIFLDLFRFRVGELDGGEKESELLKLLFFSASS